ncbi:IPT/TIG domain-containing protein [Bradyrhizobium sediminis]|uniref:IPT/TIG domain-containing protein n=1 Tax=Bradyrhizobium sediminis TaxID=2840469 RepID=A0A975NMV4_9BRAD|nr:IPT/TIG domain-containing protein [Bradyrhizobium sediminis]QWG17379.1 IPT/TIG domain-containing protein [Bradyrhizobium sediminis]
MRRLGSLPRASLYALLAIIGCFFASAGPAVSQPLVKSAIQVDAGNTKLVGQTFAFRLTYNCTSISGPCLNGEVDDLLPAEVTFMSTVPAAPTGDIAAVNVTPNFGGSGRTRVQFVFVSPLTAGNSGDLIVNVQFPAGTAAGTTASNTADAINLGASPGTFTTPAVTVTAKAAPTVTATAPTTGTTLGGTAVTITGTNFIGTPTVTIGGNPATGVTVVNGTTITATTPAHAVGAVDVVVTTPGGTGTGSGLYTYTTPAPGVTAITPNSGTRLGGTAVTITGTNFTGTTAVAIGGIAATAFAVVNDTTITATTPAHAPGTVDVAVTTPSGPGIGAGLYAFAQTSTSTTLTSSLNPATVGQAVTFTAAVSSGSGTPTGSVTFMDGTTNIGSAALSAGTASLTVSTLTVGVHSITVVYAGNANFASSTSAVLAQSINVPADSTNLRALQIAATKMVAQGSGQAISGAIDAAISDGFSGNQPPVSPSGSGLRFNFGAEVPDGAHSGATQYTLRDPAMSSGPGSGRVDHAFSALASIDKAAKAPPPRATPREWLAWADVQTSRVNQQHGALTGPTFYGGQINALIGLTHKLAPDVLVGVLGGYETFDYRSDALVGRLKGDGWTVGSYLGWRILPGLRFDAAAAYSGIGYDGTAGTAAGTFNGKRLLVTSGLTGSYVAGGFTIEPSAKVYALWERQNAYVDSLGTSQAEHSFATGRASGGLKVIYPVAWTSSVGIAPYAGLYADYYFTGDDAAVLIAPGLLASQPFQTGWSARTVAGIATSFANGAVVTLGGEYGGIGSHTQLWTVRGRANVPF